MRDAPKHGAMPCIDVAADVAKLDEGKPAVAGCHKAIPGRELRPLIGNRAARPVLDSARCKMDTQAVSLALERSRAMSIAAQAVVRRGAARVASNHASIRERGERTS